MVLSASHPWCRDQSIEIKIKIDRDQDQSRSIEINIGAARVGFHFRKYGMMADRRAQKNIPVPSVALAPCYTHTLDSFFFVHVKKKKKKTLYQFTAEEAFFGRGTD